MHKNGKWLQYSAKINAQIGEMLANEDSDNYIGIKELVEGENLKEFFHALATVAPCFIFNKMTNENKNHIEFNHVANLLCFEYSEKEK